MLWLLRNKSTFEGLVEALKSDLAPFSHHLFNAKWQYQRYCSISTDVSAETVIFCMGYAENYMSRQQDVPQGFHWKNIQTMLHPVVTTYKCWEPDCDHIITDSIVFVSNDLRHDHYGVQHLLTNSIEVQLGEGVVFNHVTF